MDRDLGTGFRQVAGNQVQSNVQKEGFDGILCLTFFRSLEPVHHACPGSFFFFQAFFCYYLEMDIINLDIVGLFMLLAGFVVGLGAVTVIDSLGFLGRKSGYFTETTIRAHKVTKPLIWLGIFLACVGGVIFYRAVNFWGIPALHLFIAITLIINGSFLSFRVSPFLLERERLGLERELLPKKWQKYITISFLVSFTGWWLALYLLTYFLLTN